MKKSAILYIRVSTDEQAETGYSQRNQEEMLNRYCSLHGIAIKAVYYEDHSAKTFERPEFKKILISFRKNRGLVDVLLFTKWDRFSRNAGDAYGMINILNKLGVEPQAIEQPLDLEVPENKLMLAFFLAAPEVENDRRSLNVISGMRRAQKEGRIMGKAPIGYKNQINGDGVKTVVPNPATSPIVRWEFEQISEGKFTTEAIIQQALNKGLKTARNNVWHAIRNPIYYGKIKLPAYKSEEEQLISGLHIPLITEALFNEVQDVLDGKKKKRRTIMLVDEKFPLKGFLACPHCGKTLTASSSRGRKMYYSYYHCISPCKARYNADEANRLFVNKLGLLKPHEAIEPLYRMIVEEVYSENEKSKNAEAKQIKEDLTREKLRMAKLRELLMTDSIDPDDYRLVKKESEKQVSSLEARWTEVNAKESDMRSHMQKAIKLLSNIDQIFINADVIKKRDIVGSIFPEKLVFDGMHFRTTRINEAVQLIFNISEGLQQIKIGQTGEFSDLSNLVIRIGFEPMTHSLEGCCSIQLSYQTFIFRLQI